MVLVVENNKSVICNRFQFANDITISPNYHLKPNDESPKAYSYIKNEFDF
jgi:hypothetical protein